MERNGTRNKEARTKKNKNGNGNGYSFKIGNCPKCGRENVPLTEHHIWKRSVWGPNNHTVFLCRECHDELEAKVRIMENMILRLFMLCYKAIYYDFMKKDEELTDDAIMKICITGLKKMVKKTVADSIGLKEGWIIRRMQKKGVLLRREE